MRELENERENENERERNRQKEEGSKQYLLGAASYPSTAASQVHNEKEMVERDSLFFLTLFVSSANVEDVVATMKEGE